MLMTGPAKLAWSIGTLLCAALLPLVARAAAPHDAIKLMPNFTHSSSFNLVETDKPSGHTFDDNYFGTWDLRWLPPPVPIGTRANAFLEFYYRTQMKDNLNQTSGSTSDGRFDRCDVVARIEGPGWSLRHEMEQKDGWDGVYPTRNIPQWDSTRIISTNLGWHQAGLPGIDVYHSLAYGYPQAGVTQGNEREALVARASYNPPGGAFSQSYSVQTEYIRSFNFANQQGSRSVKTVYEGHREIPLGVLGSLIAGYHSEETDNSGPGTFSPQITSSNSYGLSLRGNANPMPLSYGFTYSNAISDLPTGLGFSHQERVLDFSFNSPVPEGKSASMIYSNAVVDNRNDPLSNGYDSSQTHRLAWEFQPNPRMHGNLGWWQTSSYDLRDHTHQSDRQGYEGKLNYTIPGKRGTVSGSYGQTVDRSPTSGSQSVTTDLNLSSQFKLGNRAKMTFFLQQQYSDTQRNPLALTSGTNKAVSGVRYSINSDYGFSVNTTWKQDFTRYTTAYNPTGTSANVASLAVDLSYNPPNTGWTYTLAIDTSDSTTVVAPTGQQDVYTTSNNFQATVVYNF